MAPEGTLEAGTLTAPYYASRFPLLESWQASRQIRSMWPAYALSLTPHTLVVGGSYAIDVTGPTQKAAARNRICKP